MASHCSPDLPPAATARVGRPQENALGEGPREWKRHRRPLRLGNRRRSDGSPPFHWEGKEW